MTLRTFAAVLWVALDTAILSRATIVSVPAFHGAASENFDQLGISGAQQQIRIFGSLGTVTNLTPDGALKLELSSSLNGDLVTPRSAPRMLGQIGISQWDFTTPLLEFGSYFENNSRFDDATVDFYGANNQLIGSVVASTPKNLQAWTWNGWQSDVPIYRVVVTGNDVAFFHGFIWFDDVQTVAVPEPGGVQLLLVPGCIFLLRRFGSANSFSAESSARACVVWNR